MKIKKEEMPVKRGPMGKVEKAGKEVMSHLLELCKNTDLSHEAMAKRLNEIYGTEFNRQNIERFLKSNTQVTELLSQKQELAELRAKLSLNHMEHLVNDIRKLDNEIEKISGEEGALMEPDRRAHAIANLIDKKGKLLLREARLSGKSMDTRGGQTNIDQINIINTEKSEIIQRLKQFKPKQEDIDEEDVIEADIEDADD